MRIGSAGRGPIVVYPAVVVGIEKRARCSAENIVVVFVDFKILIDELRGFYPQPLGEPIDVAVGNDWAGGFATIGASEAIHFLKSFVVQILHDVVEPGRWFSFEFVDELFVLLLFELGRFSDGFG